MDEVAERQSELAVTPAADLIDQADDVGNGIDHRRFHVACQPGNVDQRDGLAGKIGDHRNGCCDHVYDRLKRAGHLRNLFDKGLDKIVDERPHVDGNVAEAHDLKTVAEVELGRARPIAPGDLPVEDETAADFRQKRLDRGRDEGRIEARGKVEVDLRLGAGAQVCAQTAQLGKRQPLVGGVRLVDQVDAELSAEEGASRFLFQPVVQRVRLVDLQLEKGDRAGQPRAVLQVHIERQNQLVVALRAVAPVVADEDVGAVGTSDAQSKGKVPGDLDIEPHVHFQSKSRDADVKAEINVRLVGVPQSEEPLEVTVIGSFGGHDVFESDSDFAVVFIIVHQQVQATEFTR